VSYDDGPAGLLEHGDLEWANYIVIGAFIRRDAFIALAGFREMDVLEDWDLWLRAQRAGLLLTPVPGAVYRVHSREGSRNYGGHGNP
jgi:GT2 family glycosyltransferase